VQWDGQLATVYCERLLQVAALTEEAAKTGTDAFTLRVSGATVVDLWIRETSKD